jgi:ribosomal protein S18 acetylase RimI-like enzyme
MAARIEPAHRTPGAEFLDLRQISAADLESLLAEEIEVWRETLDWDFGKSAELVERFVDLHALRGYALLQGGAVTGYAYYVFEDQKGLIGDLYIQREARTEALENQLLEQALAGLRDSGVRRIESQLILADKLRRMGLADAPYLTVFDRNFMRLDLHGRLPEGRLRRAAHIERWSEQYLDAAAQLIAQAYAGHVDSRINDQYCSPTGARHFLFNIVQYPGCGTFHRAASFAAFDAATGRMCGACLASIVSPRCGHITQVCVSPWARGARVGYELLRHSLEALGEHGCTAATLTVTAANSDAVALYERMGFRTIRRFSAYVWEGF